MGLINARNLRKAKQLLEKNRHKVSGIVDKAGEKLDKVSNGKTSNVTSKAADAAKKYSSGGVQHHGIDTPLQPTDQNMHSGAPMDPAATNAAGIAAANAVTAAATAAANLMNNAAVQAQIAQAQQGGGVNPATGEKFGDDKVQATHKPQDVTGGADDGADWSSEGSPAS